MRNPTPPPANLREHVSYDAETGEFTWKKWSRGRGAVGSNAKSIAPNGYGIISFNKRRYMSSHIAWWLVHQEWPSAPIDHENRNRADDRIDNLRVGTYGQNITNGPMRKNNTSGYRGVCLDKKQGRWMAYVQPNRTFKFLGYYSTPEEAARVRDVAAVEHFGEFARLNFPKSEVTI